jgi:hypothetical protein
MNAPLSLLGTSEIKFFAFFSLFFQLRKPFAMTSKPLEILKRGLAKFSKRIRDRKDTLDARLAQGETISSADEHWLDHEANIVDEQRVIDDLEAASDYERGLARLDDTGRAIVKKIGEWAGDLVQIAGNKRKRTYTSCV